MSKVSQLTNDRQLIALMTEPESRTSASLLTGRLDSLSQFDRREAGVEREDDSSTGSGHPASRRLSYKFQRLRERIRAAIDAGELVGKLPGERSLARQFNVNAKTLSKALTDLAAEGVLERNIGLGTFVRDGTNTSATQSRILMLADHGSESLINALAARGLQAQAHTDTADLPPSLVSPFDLILVASDSVRDETVRDLIVRGKNVVALNRQTRPYSTNAVLPHAPHAAVHAAKRLAAMGHKKLLVVAHPDHDDIHHSVAHALPNTETRSATAAEAVAAQQAGFTAAVCDAQIAPEVLNAVRSAGLSVPDAFSLMAYGRLGQSLANCCGHYVTDDCVAQALADLVAAGLPHKPLTLWLSGIPHDAGTSAPPTVRRY